MRADESIDDLNIRGLKILQKKNGFRYGIDAVLLSDFAKVPPGGLVLDMCAGGGIVPLLLFARQRPKKIYAIEIMEELTDMARRSVQLNGIENIEIVKGDVREIEKHFQCGIFDAVTCNPPYSNVGSGAASEKEEKAAARHELMCTIEDVVYAASRVLKYCGRLFLIHRPGRLADIFAAMRHNRIEPKRVRFVHSKADREPRHVLVEGMLGARPALKVMPPLIVYDENGEYTAEINRIYGKDAAENEG